MEPLWLLTGGRKQSITLQLRQSLLVCTNVFPDAENDSAKPTEGDEDSQHECGNR